MSGSHVAQAPHVWMSAPAGKTAPRAEVPARGDRAKASLRYGQPTRWVLTTTLSKSLY
jgi:hypothetical protein